MLNLNYDFNDKDRLQAILFDMLNRSNERSRFKEFLKELNYAIMDEDLKTHKNSLPELESIKLGCFCYLLRWYCSYVEKNYEHNRLYKHGSDDTDFFHTFIQWVWNLMGKDKIVDDLIFDRKDLKFEVPRFKHLFCRFVPWYYARDNYESHRLVTRNKTGLITVYPDSRYYWFSPGCSVTAIEEIDVDKERRRDAKLILEEPELWPIDELHAFIEQMTSLMTWALAPPANS